MLQILNVVVSFFGAFEHFFKINQMSFALYMDFFVFVCFCFHLHLCSDFGSDFGSDRISVWISIWISVRISFPIPVRISVWIFVRFWQSYFIKLFGGGLQCEFIRTFYKNYERGGLEIFVIEPNDGMISSINNWCITPAWWMLIAAVCFDLRLQHNLLELEQWDINLQIVP